MSPDPAPFAAWLVIAVACYFAAGVTRRAQVRFAPGMLLAAALYAAVTAACLVADLAADVAAILRGVA